MEKYLLQILTVDLTYTESGFAIHRLAAELSAHGRKKVSLRLNYLHALA